MSNERTVLVNEFWFAVRTKTAATGELMFIPPGGVNPDTGLLKVRRGSDGADGWVQSKSLASPKKNETKRCTNGVVSCERSMLGLSHREIKLTYSDDIEWLGDSHLRTVAVPDLYREAKYERPPKIFEHAVLHAPHHLAYILGYCIESRYRT